jgi:hypothetical protein
MGGSASSCKINFEKMQQIVNCGDVILIHTMDRNKQDCLIKSTLTADQEVDALNKAINSFENPPTIVIYGANACDATIVEKYNQLTQLGFHDVQVYPGGVFEWLLLQDIYGAELFPTTIEHADILKYK